MIKLSPLLLKTAPKQQPSVDRINVRLLCCQLFQYISDSGGVLGLWFGFAIMTFIEFFEFFVDFTVLTVNKICNSF